MDARKPGRRRGEVTRGYCPSVTRARCTCSVLISYLQLVETGIPHHPDGQVCWPELQVAAGERHGICGLHHGRAQKREGSEKGNNKRLILQCYCYCF